MSTGKGSFRPQLHTQVYTSQDPDRQRTKVI